MSPVRTVCCLLLSLFLAWYRKGTEKNFARSQTGLGLFLQEGRGVPVNLQEALVWMQRAAGNGHAQAIDMLSRSRKLPGSQ